MSFLFWKILVSASTLFSWKLKQLVCIFVFVKIKNIFIKLSIFSSLEAETLIYIFFKNEQILLSFWDKIE